MLALTTGRIAGISGIVSRLLPPDTMQPSNAVGAAFVIGLLLALPLFTGITGNAPTITISGGTATMIIAGLIVGVGTVIGSGCTSGHGVCGLSRFSTRSMVATAIFMLSAMVTVFIVRHVIGGGP